MDETRLKAVPTTQHLFITLVLLLGITFTGPSYVTADSFPPLPEALAALESDVDVTVSEVTVTEWPADSNY